SAYPNSITARIIAIICFPSSRCVIASFIPAGYYPRKGFSPSRWSGSAAGLRRKLTGGAKSKLICRTFRRIPVFIAFAFGLNALDSFLYSSASDTPASSEGAAAPAAPFPSAPDADSSEFSAEPGAEDVFFFFTSLTSRINYTSIVQLW
ncbi:hypothetical protein TcCL_Unassigned04239, partial [Trypanosoma cruzi]